MSAGFLLGERRSVLKDNPKTHDALVADWQENVKKHDEDNYLFLRSLKRRPFKKVDRIALELHQEAFSIVDCTKCANCCRTLRPVFNDQDIERIASHLGVARDELIAAYLERDEQGSRYRIKATPCPFLGQDSRCTIYDVRPEKCRGYPFTDKPDFASSTITHAYNAVVCPAAFYLVEQMRRRLGRCGR
jgi:Fe-S-cluster containining protein